MVHPRGRKIGRIALGVALGLGLLVLAFLLILHLTSPSPKLTSAAVPEKAIPADWGAPSVPVEAMPLEALPLEAGPLEAGPLEALPPGTSTASAAWSSTGSLAIKAGGRPFGEETYQIEVSASGATLSSTGLFWINVVLTTVRVTFEQHWEGAADLRPDSYSLHIDAPLGLGQEIVGTREEDRFVVRRNGTETSTLIAPERTVVLGMLSTYTLMPLLFAEHEENGVATFDALIFGEQPGAAAGSPRELPVVVVERDGTTDLAVNGTFVAADRYRIRTPLGDSTLYAKGNEFLALTAATEGRPLLVYRSDYFPDGFSLAGAAASQ